MTQVSSRTANVGGHITSNSPPAWNLLYLAGLTKDSYWVKMHMISDKLGGQPKDENLLSAPGAINTGPVLTFEKQAKKLITTPTSIPKGQPAFPAQHTGKKYTVLWITAQTTGFHPAGTTSVPSIPTYDDKTFATGIQLRAGLVIYNPGASPKWERDNTVILRADVSLPLPNWGGRTKAQSIHFMSRSALEKATKCSPEFAILVKQMMKDPVTGADKMGRAKNVMLSYLRGK